MFLLGARILRMYSDLQNHCYITVYYIHVHLSAFLSDPELILDFQICLQVSLLKYF
jgi:hypothetical protein